MIANVEVSLFVILKEKQHLGVEEIGLIFTVNGIDSIGKAIH